MIVVLCRFESHGGDAVCVCVCVCVCVAQYLGKFVALAPQTVLHSLAFATAFYGAHGPEGDFLELWLVLMLLHFTVGGFSALITAAFPPALAFTVGLGTIVVMYLFSGIAGLSKNELEASLGDVGTAGYFVSFVGFAGRAFAAVDWRAFSPYRHSIEAKPLEAVWVRVHVWGERGDACADVWVGSGD